MSIGPARAGLVYGGADGMSGWLQIRKDNTMVANSHLTGSRIVIGRSPDCDVVLASDSVSRQHAELVAHGDNWSVRDLGSRNGTFVNGKRAEGVVPLREGDLIRIGTVELIFRGDASARDAGAVPVAPVAKLAPPAAPSSEEAADGAPDGAPAEPTKKYDLRPRRRRTW